MKNNKINIACWSIGQHAVRNILPAIKKCEGVVLAGIYTRNKTRLVEQCTLYNCKQFSGLSDFLDDPSIDAIYLSSPTGVHEEQIRICLAHGKSVLVEKTALPNAHILKELLEIALSKGLIIMEAFMYRFHKQFDTLKEILHSKKYGRVINIQCEFGFPHLDHNDIRYSKELCGGALYDAGAYTLSAARNLLPQGARVVWSQMTTENKYEVDTSGSAILMVDSVYATCSWVFGGSYKNRISVWCQDAHVICERAFSKPSDYESYINIEKNGELIDCIVTGKDNHFVNMLNHFSMSIVSENKNEIHELVLQSKILESTIALSK